MKRKIQKRFMDHGLGFPLVLENVPMMKVFGEWIPDINYNPLEEAMVEVVAQQTERLTGNEIRFLRLHFGMPLEALAKLFAVTRQALMRWEKFGKKPTAMTWAIEKDLRLYALGRMGIRPARFMEAYERLREPCRQRSEEPCGQTVKRATMHIMRKPYNMHCAGANGRMALNPLTV